MFSKLMKKDFKVVENFGGLVTISIMIILAGIIFMCAFGLNLGLDYEGGAKVEIELTNEVTAYDKEFEAELTDLFKKGGYTVSDKMQKSPLSGGTGYTYEFRLNYELNGNNMGATKDTQNQFIESLNGKDDDADDLGFKGDIEEAVRSFLDKKNLSSHYEEGCVKIAVIGASSSKSLINSTFLAIALALVAILVYIIIRFTLSSGIAAFCGLTHDVLFMIALTAIFQIPVNMTFIAAVITIIGYSINSSIVIFDKVRECLKSAAFAYASDAEIANYAIKHSLVKILLSILTTLIMVVALVLYSVSTIQEFIIPIIFGLVAGTFSALCLSPSLWVIFRKIGAKIKKKKA